MIEDRNLTVHTYEEALARQIAARVPEYARLLSSWIEAVASQPSPDAQDDGRGTTRESLHV
jgi:hypothetical protein